MKSILLLVISVFLGLICEFVYAQNEIPIIENLTYLNDELSGELTINFNIRDMDNNEVFVSMQIREGSRTQMFFPENLSGDYGPQTIGSNKTITWNYKSEFQSIESFDIKLMVNDGEEVNIDAMVEQVSKPNLESWLEFIAKPRSIKFAPSHLDAVRDSIYDYFNQLGLPTSKQEFLMLTNEVGNVIGEKTGHESPNKIYIVDAHFDGKDNAPGADDNASGTAGFLEAARILSKYSFKKSIYFIGFDQEENSLSGSREFVFAGGRKPWEEYLGVLNLEMIGYYSEEENSQEIPTGFDLLFPELYEEQVENGFKGDFILSASNDFSEKLGKDYVSTLNKYVPELKTLEISLPNGLGVFGINFLRSDHANFWAADIPALMITDGSEFRNENYHTKNDVVETIDFDFMTNVVKGTVGALAELAEPIHGSEVNFKIEKRVLNSVKPDHQACDLPYNYDNKKSILVLKLNACMRQNDFHTINIYDLSGRLVHSKDYNFESSMAFKMEQNGVIFVVLEGNGRISHKKIALY